MAAVDMTVDVQSIPNGGTDRTWTCNAQILELDPDVVELCGQATVAAHIARNGREVRVRGDVRARLGLTCGRCLEPFEQEAALPLEVVYLPESDRGEAGQADLNDSDVNLAWYDGARFDVRPEVRDVVLLSVPMSPVCRAECQGLCPRCGTNLNAGPCGCPPEQEDSPFAALDGLKARLAADAADSPKDD